ncbi:MAG: ribosome maturation factor RimP [Campylobacteraceae bacterium]|jgi:ribosome maturation factor RimP|nr:ribosome maturation factor RimP [Campylobacteraceae bacterium]
MNENIEKLIESCGVKLYDMESVTENGHKIFRVYITSKDGIDLEKCEKISKILSPIFDLNPPVSGHYYFEVSSPGIERNLKLPKHFKASIGEKVKIKLDNEESIKGTIQDADDDGVEVGEDNNLQKILYENIKKARTYFEW